MPKPTTTFADITGELVKLNRQRDALERKALQLLESTHPGLADLLIQGIGEGQRSARWLLVARRAFGGRTACELLAEGDIDEVSDEIARMSQLDTSRLGDALPLVY